MMSSRKSIVAFALFATLLVVAVQPVTAATNTAIGSIHETSTELNNGTLDNVKVKGSGASAFVSYGDSNVDSFERAALDHYTGSTGAYAINDTFSFNGTRALVWDDSGTDRIYSLSGLPNYPARGDNFSVRIYSNDTTTTGGGVFFGVEDTNNYYRVLLRTDDSELQLHTIDGGSATELDNASITVPQDDWMEINVSWGTDDTITAVVYNEAGATLATVSATNDNHASGTGIGFITFEAGGTGGPWWYDHFVIEDHKNGSYQSANHSVSNADTGFTDLTLDNASANVTWQEFTGGSWSDIRTDTYTTTGNKSVDISSATSSTLRVNVTFEDLAGETRAKLHDEGVEFTNHAPEFDNSTALPQGGAEIGSDTVNLNITLNDTEFGTAQGDSVDVDFYVNGSLVGSNNSITSNGTVSLEYTPTTGGMREWSAVAKDDYGGSNISDNFTFAVPSQVQIREETSPHNPINTVTVTVKFFENVQDEPTIIERTTSTGNISLTGLPVNSEFVATVKAQGYHNRTVVITNIFQQDTVFLLNTSRTTVNNTFTLDDATGDFSAEDGVTFFIQKAINQSEYSTGGWAWITVSGDNMGAQQLFQDNLEFEDRYRLRIENDDGDARILGEYLAKQSGTVTLAVGSVNITPTEGTTYAWNATFNDSGSNFIRFSFNDTEDGTTDLDLTVYEWGNESNVLATDLNNAGPFGTFSFSQQVTGVNVNKTWVVEWNATKNGSAIGGADVIGRQDIGPTLPLDAVWLEVGSVGALVLAAGAVGGLLNPAVGALVLAMLGGLLWQLGFLPAEIGGGAIVLAFLVAGSWLVIHSRSEP